MREVPLRYVKANQAGIVVTVLLSFLLDRPWVLAALWAIQIIGLATDGKLNLFARIGKALLKDPGQETQALELTRFNNLLAVLFLTLSLLSFAVGWPIAGYAFAAMLLLAASMALLGFCIGCTVYFWVKQIRAGRRIF
ncbi:DUF4395 domain-containing protein [Cohnella suwonensis]|uniref:DUF4395 domain-containing protein n=1 Tax=Cohnella suwonensis TaxID=696072 RepID=A0ABW0LX10_9BACL